MRNTASNPELRIRDGSGEELLQLGQLLVRVYSSLPGFPSPTEQPGYYEMLANIGRFAEKPGAKVLVALSPSDGLVGGVVYFGDMAHYGSAGTATIPSSRRCRYSDSA
ncbi:hypothetical protein [Variovorax sp. dw_954]|uniref:hypothetical protein n=1 Tax=Variovorax sp. dw_954 TaxID=2720078 RepID=UPI001BD68015|nr:hypothetical protein [Variovorax sp. dw_954]